MIKNNAITIRLCDTCEGLIEKQYGYLTLKIKGDRGESARIVLNLKDKFGEREVDFFHDLHFCSKECIMEFFNHYSYNLANLEKK